MIFSQIRACPPSEAPLPPHGRRPGSPLPSSKFQRAENEPPTKRPMARGLLPGTPCHPPINELLIINPFLHAWWQGGLALSLRFHRQGMDVGEEKFVLYFPDCSIFPVFDSSAILGQRQPKITRLIKAETGSVPECDTDVSPRAQQTAFPLLIPNARGVGIPMLNICLSRQQFPYRGLLHIKKILPGNHTVYLQIIGIGHI